ncbi:thioesterase family protein [Halenospora varia]|nr:thioesterase family protein [Halenospora varia]
MSHDDVTRELEDFINNHPMVIKLKSQPEFSKSISKSEIRHNFIERTLTGPGKIVVSPFTWMETGGKSLVQISYLGMDLCGHPGIGFANCCSAAFPNKNGMTANLNINFRAPVFARNFVVLRANTTKVQGRKIWVEGHIETLVTEGEKPVVLVEASALFIELRQSAVGANLSLLAVS